MSARNCPACGRDGRRGGTRVLLVPLDGKPRNAIVCKRCAARAVLIVAERLECQVPGCSEPAGEKACAAHQAQIDRWRK